MSSKHDETVRTWAKVQTTFTGLHHWEDAFDEVAFLRNAHRHEFHVTLQIEQTHDDRDVEYIRLKRALDQFLEDYGSEGKDGKYLNDRSCEMMAKDVLKWARGEYGVRHMKCELLEDGENGAIVDAPSTTGIER